MYQIIREPPRTGMKCGYCGTRFIPQYPNQKYCTKTCSKKKQREQNADYQRRRYAQVKNKAIIDNRPFRPGTGNLTGKPLADNNAEYERVRAELRRLGLKKE